MVAFTFRMPAGIPGQVTRLEQATIEPQAYDPAVAFPAYGVPAKIAANGKVQPIAAGDVATSIYGLLVRPYPSNSSQDPLGTSTPPTPGAVANILVRGYMMALLGGTAAAVKNGQVYVRVANAVAGKPIGGLEAAADGTNTVAPAGFTFNGPADAAGNVEVRFNI